MRESGAVAVGGSLASGVRQTGLLMTDLRGRKDGGDDGIW